MCPSVGVVSRSGAQELKRSKYRLLGLVGQGQFGRVYCAIHRKTGRLVALKELDRRRFPTHKFLRELRFLLSLRHTNIVTCQALEHVQTRRYLVMDYCEGGTLRDLMEEERSLQSVHVVRLVLDVLAGLAHAHGQGIVHCDIKPENILLRVMPTGWLAQITDFGIARLSQEIATLEGSNNTGSPAYMAPERFYGQYSPASDLYAVGVLLFELLLGRRPFSGPPADLMSAHLNQPLVIPPEVPGAIAAVLRRSLQKLPGRRFPSALEMAQALQEAAIADGLMDASGTTDLFRAQPARSLQPFQAVQEQMQWLPVQQIVVDQPRLVPSGPATPIGERIYWAMGPMLSVQQFAKGIWSDAGGRTGRTQQINLPEVVEAIALQEHGVLALTQQAAYSVTADAAQDWTVSRRVWLEPNALTAWEAQGRWLAVATPRAGDSAADLTLYDGPNLNHRHHLPLKHFPRQLLAVDRRHGVAVATKREGDRPTGTTFEGFSRRGQSLGILATPLLLDRLVLTPKPYRLMATEQNQPQSLVILDLKPFRILRLSTRLVPTFMAAMAWGYILVSQAGEILLLDEVGREVGWIAGPPNPTAIAPIHPAGLMIATTEGQQSMLYTVDLRQLEIDLLF